MPTRDSLFPPDPLPACEPFAAALEHGRSLRRAGDFSGAELAFIRASRLDPRHPEPLRERARLCWSRGDVEQAEELLLLVIAGHPDDALSAVLLARLLVQRDAVTLAAEVIGRAVGHCPDHPLLLLAE